MHIIRDSSWCHYSPNTPEARAEFERESDRFDSYIRSIANHILFVVDLNHRAEDVLAGVPLLQPYINSLSRDIIPYHQVFTPRYPDSCIPLNRCATSSFDIHSRELSDRYRSLVFQCGIDYNANNQTFTIHFVLSIPHRDLSGDVRLAEGALEFSDLYIAEAGVSGEVKLHRIDFLTTSVFLGHTPTCITRSHHYTDRHQQQILSTPNTDNIIPDISNTTPRE
jgi:hypothetical protein